MKIIIETTSFDEDKLKEIIMSSSHDVWFILLCYRSSRLPYQDYGDFASRISFKYYDDFEGFNNLKNLSVVETDLIKFIEIINNHQITPLLSNRYGRFGSYGPGLFHYSRYVTGFIFNVFQFFERVKPDLIFYRSTPHNLQEWPMAYVAELMEIPVLVVELNMVFWRHQVCSGFKRDRKICRFKDPEITQASKNEEILFSRFIEIAESDYQSALPTYEKKKLSRNKSKLYHPIKEVINWWYRPDKMYNKWVCYKAFMKYSTDQIPDQPFFIFFLHYQPERTTLPDGFGFSQQILAIMALRMALPREVKLLVKEHPSIFTHQCMVRDRHPSFYKDIDDIEGVQLVHPLVDSFDLIDRSIGAGTITGTVGREALLRGKPAIYFGRSVYKNIKGSHEYQSLDKLKAFVKAMVHFTEAEIKESTVLEMTRSREYSVSGFPDDHDPNTSDFYNREYRMNAHLKILKAIIEGQLILPEKNV